MPTRSSIVATSPVADATPVTYSMHTGQLWLETGQQSATRVSRSTIVATSPVADATPVTYSMHTGQLWLETGRLTSQKSATRLSNRVQIGQPRAHTGHFQVHAGHPWRVFRSAKGAHRSLQTGQIRRPIACSVRTGHLKMHAGRLTSQHSAPADRCDVRGPRHLSATRSAEGAHRPPNESAVSTRIESLFQVSKAPPGPSHLFAGFKP